MKNMQTWLDEYGESHQNPTNKTIHWICVPAIFFSIIGLLTEISLGDSPYWSVATGVVVAGLIFYIRLSPTLFVGMALGSAFCLWGNVWLDTHLPMKLWQFSLAIFALAWVGQFYGHHVEGKKPSFIKDLQFLLIGPAWLMHFIYRRMGWKY
jgi:uncharacterized membrane protein YGL010W